MRKYLFAILALLFSMHCFAQEMMLKNEIGTHILSYSIYPFEDKYGRIGVANEDEKRFNFVNGITYKRFLSENNALRFSFESRKLSSMNRKNYTGHSLRQGNYHENILKTGFEKTISSNKLSPYVAADISWIYVKFKGSYKSLNYLSVYDLDGFGLGVSYAFGIKYNLTKHLSLNAESCINLAYFRFLHLEDTTRFNDATFYTTKTIGNFNPLQKLSLNVKF